MGAHRRRRCGGRRLCVVRSELCWARLERSVALCVRALVRSHVRAPARLTQSSSTGEKHVCRGCAWCVRLCVAWGVGARARSRARAPSHQYMFVRTSHVDVGGCTRSRALPRTCLHRASRVCMCAGLIVVCDSCIVVLDGCWTTGGGNWDRVSPSPSLPRKFSSHSTGTIFLTTSAKCWSTPPKRVPLGCAERRCRVRALCGRRVLPLVPHLVWARCTHVLA